MRMKMRMKLRDEDEDEDGLHEVVSIADTIVSVRSRENLGKLVGFDVRLAVFSMVAKVVDKNGGSTLEGMHLNTR